MIKQLICEQVIKININDRINYFHFVHIRLVIIISR